MQARLRIVFPLLILGMTALLPRTGATGELAADLQEAIHKAAPPEALPVIIQFRERVTLVRSRGETQTAFRLRYNRILKATADRSQATLTEWLNGQGVSDLRQFWTLNALAGRIPVQLLRELAQRPEVESVRLDREIPMVPAQR
jgi:hypothetical protein